MISPLRHSRLRPFAHSCTAMLAALLWLLAALHSTASLAQSRAQVESGETLTLQLRWTPQFQFAGYYAALWQGYYREAGLNVRIAPGEPGKQPHKQVLSGEAHYGVGNSEVLLSYLRGNPLVALAAIGQHSPSVLLTRKDSGIRTPQDLIGKRIMMFGGANDIEFLALLANEGGSWRRSRL